MNDALLALQQAQIDSPRTLYIYDAPAVVGRLLRNAYLARTVQATAL